MRYKDLALNTLNSSLRHLERTGRAAGKQPELRSTTAPRPCREVDRLRAMIDKLSSIKVNKDFRIQDPTAPHTTPATQNNAAPATRPTTTTRAEFVPYYRELEKGMWFLFWANKLNKEWWHRSGGPSIQLLRLSATTTMTARDVLALSWATSSVLYAPRFDPSF